MAKADVNEPVTRGMLNDAVEAVLKGVDQLMNGLKGEMISRFKKVDDRLDKLEVELSCLKGTELGL